MPNDKGININPKTPPVPVVSGIEQSSIGFPNIARKQSPITEEIFKA